MVTGSDIPEHEDAESGAQTPPPRDIITKITETTLGDVINFIEANQSHADKNLTPLCPVMADINYIFQKVLIDNQQC